MLTMPSAAELRPTLLAVGATAAAWYVWASGVPTDRTEVLIALLAVGAIATLGQSGRTRQMLRDWLPMWVLLIAYDLTRGAADTLGMPVHTRLPIAVDEFVFAGRLPTHSLQRWLLSPRTAWWEAIVAVVYVSHFVVPLSVGMALWTTNRERFRIWRRRFLALTAAGLTTYILVPTRPPWMAARLGAIDPVARTAPRGLRLLGLGAADRLLDLGRLSVNQVAALPSLHAAYAALPAVSLWHIGRLRPLLVAYPAVMAFSLVVGGEHYVFDLWLGWVYVVAVVVATSAWEHRRAAG
jgi:PAP2 superfamily